MEKKGKRTNKIWTKITFLQDEKNVNLCVHVCACVWSGEGEGDGDGNGLNHLCIDFPN